MVGGSSGGCAAIAFAARFPERVDGLLLYGAYADGSSITSPEVRGDTSFYGAVALGSWLAHFGDLFLGETTSVEQNAWRADQRAAASPETAARLLEYIYRNNVRTELAKVDLRRSSCIVEATAPSPTSSAVRSQRPSRERRSFRSRGTLTFRRRQPGC